MSRAFRCPTCESPTWGDLKFCPKCGEPLDISCPGCGFTIRYIQAETYIFCPKCGVKMGGGPKPPVKQGEPA